MTEVAEHRADWRAVSASRRGSSHGSGVPNQDAVRCEQVTLSDGAVVWVAAVADGHGGSRYVRSDVGAQTAVDVAVDAVRQALAAAPAQDSLALLRAGVPGIVQSWGAIVRAHLAAHPLSEHELARAGHQPPLGGSLTAYGATLLIAVVGDQGVAVAQVGDGDALVRSHGFATKPVPGDDRLVAGETTSLCLDSAVDDFRFAALPATAEPDLVLLATDGYGNSFAQADWWHALLGDVASFVARLGFHQLQEQLPDWLEESARIGGDDVSAVFLVREPLAVAPEPVGEPAPESRELPARTLDLPGSRDHHGTLSGGPIEATPRRRPRARLVAALAALVAVLGVIAALILLAPDASRAPDETPPSPTRISTPSVDPSTDHTGKGGRHGKDQKSGTAPRNLQRRLPGDPGGGSGTGSGDVAPVVP